MVKSRRNNAAGNYTTGEQGTHGKFCILSANTQEYQSTELLLMDPRDISLSARWQKTGETMYVSYFQVSWYSSIRFITKSSNRK